MGTLLITLINIECVRADAFEMKIERNQFME